MECNANTRERGNGFRDHGVATPISNHRGTVATMDGDGRNLVLLWLYDHRGGYALLMIDARTGHADQFPVPFDQRLDGPFASVLSSCNRFYSHFVEFDPARRAFTFHHPTVPQMAMSMTEDDAGRIWSGAPTPIAPPPATTRPPAPFATTATSMTRTGPSTRARSPPTSVQLRTADRLIRAGPWCLETLVTSHAQTPAAKKSSGSTT